jgi:hypothetical protein
MREQRIWRIGMRYLWTDALGVVLLVSLYHTLKQNKFLDEAQRVVADVDRVLGRRRGFRIGEAADRDGQYFHYLAMWIFALSPTGQDSSRGCLVLRRRLQLRPWPLLGALRLGLCLARDLF